MTRRIPLPHPGEVLREEFLEPMALSVYAVAKSIGVPRSRLSAICHGEQGVTAAIALRLGKYFDVDPRWFMKWLAVQSASLIQIAPTRTMPERTANDNALLKG